MAVVNLRSPLRDLAGGSGTVDPSRVSFDVLAGMGVDPPATSFTQFPVDLDSDSAAFSPDVEALLQTSTSHFDDAYYGPVRSSTKPRSKRHRLSCAVARQGRGRGGHMLPMRV